METVPALNSERLAAKLVVAGDAPHVGGDAVLLAEDLLGPEDLVEDGTAAEELRHSLAAVGGLQPVDAAQDALADAFRHLGHGVILVVHRDVVEAILVV